MIMGVDEAGRGALVGDVVAAAVVLPERYHLPKLNDSKQISAKVRESLFTAITEQALAYGIAHATPDEIDALNIHHATLLAMQRAIEAVQKALCHQNFGEIEVLVDGKFVPNIDYHAKAIVGGDASVPSIAAASILAKVTRDRTLLRLHEKYPEYGFHQHKGYATSKHLEAIKRFGALPEHRHSFAPLKSQQLSLF